MDYSQYEIPALLDEARRLQQLAEHRMTWDELTEIIRRCELGALVRHPEVEHLYAQYFNPRIRRKYGSVEAYLKDKLGWAAEKPVTDEIHEDPPHRPYWTRDQETRVRLNDWAYSVPAGVEHYVVWVPTPLFHPALCKPHSAHASAPSANGTSPPSNGRSSWQWVSENGLSGETGSDDPDALEVSDRGPGREVDAFVRSRWRPDHGYQTLWFANPPSLQSVPGLAHFHVLVRRKQA